MSIIGQALENPGIASRSAALRNALHPGDGTWTRPGQYAGGTQLPLENGKSVKAPQDLNDRLVADVDLGGDIRQLLGDEGGIGLWSYQGGYEPDVITTWSRAFRTPDDAFRAVDGLETQPGSVVAVMDTKSGYQLVKLKSASASASGQEHLSLDAMRGARLSSAAGNVVAIGQPTGTALSAPLYFRDTPAKEAMPTKLWTNPRPPYVPGLREPWGPE